MITKVAERTQAIALRRGGRTYNEILAAVPVAKSTLSLWLRSIMLAKPQQQRITEKKIEAQRRAAQRKRELRIEKTERIQLLAQREVGRIAKRELWLIGSALYWAEGAKAKEHLVSAQVKFSNTDPTMIRIFLRWLLECCGVAMDQIELELYIHENHQHRLSDIISRWSREIGIPKQSFERVYYKRHQPSGYRKNTGEQYLGTLRVSVRASTNLNRKIAGWILGITSSRWGVV